MGSRGGDGFPVPGNCCDFYRERKEEAGEITGKVPKIPWLGIFIQKAVDKSRMQGYNPVLLLMKYE